MKQFAAIYRICFRESMSISYLKQSPKANFPPTTCDCWGFKEPSSWDRDIRRSLYDTNPNFFHKEQGKSEIPQK